MCALLVSVLCMTWCLVSRWLNVKLWAVSMMPPVICDNALFHWYPVTVLSQHLILCLGGKWWRLSDHDDRKKQQSPQGNKGVKCIFLFSVITKDVRSLHFLSLSPRSTDQAGMWREHARPVRQRAHVPVSPGAEPPLARPVSRWNPETEATPPHTEESGLCRQLPSQAGVPAWSLGEAENGAPERGGEAGGRECRHEKRAGGPGGTPCCAPEVCQRFGSRRGPPASYCATP